VVQNLPARGRKTEKKKDLIFLEFNWLAIASELATLRGSNKQI
jgi:hypothetical protein